MSIYGSLRRDLDIIAAPWMKWAVPAKELVSLIAKVCGGRVIQEPSKHVHGRLSFQIHLGEVIQNQYNSDAYIDISVFEPWEQPSNDSQ